MVRGPHNFWGALVAQPAPANLIPKLLLQPTPETEIVYQIWSC